MQFGAGLPLVVHRAAGLAANHPNVSARCDPMKSAPPVIKFFAIGEEDAA